MLYIDKQSDSFHFNPEDEIYLSDGEPDLLNQAVRFETDDIYLSDDEDQVKKLNRISSKFDHLNNIKPETCIQDSEDLLRTVYMLGAI